MGDKPDDILHRVSHLEDGDSSRDIYDDWSEIYDAHLSGEFGYISPDMAARALAAATPARDIPVIDYGCGTGLVGEALREQGFACVDGIDVSTGMLDRARSKGGYRNLLCADLTARLELDEASYGGATCIGSMGAGHVGAAQVPELLRPLRSGAPFVIIMNGAYYSAGGFDAAFCGLESDGAWNILRLEEINYMTELDRPGWLLVAEKGA
jgi:SAM-dependent methyltransferase